MLTRYDRLFEEAGWRSEEITNLREVLSVRESEIESLKKKLRATEHQLWIANEQLKCVRMHTDEKTNELMSLRRIVANMSDHSWTVKEYVPVQ